MAQFRHRRAAVWTFAKALFGTNLRAVLAQRGAFAIQALFMMLNNVVFFVFWWVLFRNVPEVRGWRLSDVEVLFGIARMYSQLAERSALRAEVFRDVEAADRWLIAQA